MDWLAATTPGLARAGTGVGLWDGYMAVWRVHGREQGCGAGLVLFGADSLSRPVTPPWQFGSSHAPPLQFETPYALP